MTKLLRFFALLALAYAQPRRLTVDEVNSGDRELLGPIDDPCSVCVATEICEPQGDLLSPNRVICRNNNLVQGGCPGGQVNVPGVGCRLTRTSKIVMSVLLSVFGLLIIALLIWCCCCRKEKASVAPVAPVIPDPVPEPVPEPAKPTLVQAADPTSSESESEEEAPIPPSSSATESSVAVPPASSSSSSEAPETAYDIIFLVDSSDSMNEDNIETEGGNIGFFQKSSECVKNALVEFAEKCPNNNSTVTVIQYSGEKQVIKKFGYQQGSGGVSTIGDSAVDHYKVEVGPTSIANLDPSSIAFSEEMDASSQIYLCLQDLYDDSFVGKLEAASATCGPRVKVVIVISDGDFDFQEGLTDASGAAVTATSIATKWNAFLGSGKMICIIQSSEVGSLTNMGEFDVAKTYIVDREGNTADESLEELISGILNTHCA